MAIISQYQAWQNGDTITSDRLNGVETNIINNGLIPSGIEDYSDTDSEMQTQTDPYPSAVVSRSTSLQGELERIRYQLAAILGETYWYIDPDNNIASMESDINTLQADAATLPSGTKMLFYQAAPPSGWTTDTGPNTRVLRVSSVAGGTTGGGSDDIANVITLAHTHTVASHTHDLGNHTHTGPSHTHSVPIDGYGNSGPGFNLGRIQTSDGSSGVPEATTSPNTGSSGTGNTGSPSTNTSGASSPATDSSLTNVNFMYANVLVATKD